MKLKTRLDSTSLIFFFIIVFYLVVLFYTVNCPQVALIGDAKEYIKEAENILQHHTVYCGDLTKEIEPDLYSRRTPLYPFFIAIFMLIFKTPYSVLFFQIFLTIINGILIIKILDLQHISCKWKNIVVICFLLYPAQIIFTNIVMSEVLLQTFLLLSFYFFVKYYSDKQLVHLLLFNLCLSGAVLIKPMMLYFWIINMLLHLWLFYKNKRREILVLPFLMILTISIWSYRNYYLTGVFHYSSIKNHNLLNYNVRGFLTSKFDSEYADEVVTAIKNSATENNNFKEAYHHIENESIKIIKNNFVSYSFFHFKGVLNFFIDPGRFDIYNFLQIKPAKGLLKLFNQYGYKGIFVIFKEFSVSVIFYLFLMAIVNTLFLGSLLYFLVKKHHDKYFKIFILTICFYVALITGPIGASRFRLPVYPFILLTLTQFQKNIENNVLC